MKQKPIDRWGEKIGRMSTKDRLKLIENWVKKLKEVLFLDSSIRNIFSSNS